MSQPFPTKQFLEIFQVTKKIKTNLTPFINQFKANNIKWMHNCYEEVYKLMIEKVDLILKFNSIFAIKFFFDCGEFVPVQITEVYFLRMLEEIAVYDIKAQDDKKGFGYFVENGYNKSEPQIEKLGFNFVKLAGELMQAASMIKPKKIYYSEETSQPSEFTLAINRMKEKGWKKLDKFAYYKEGQIEALRAAYLQNMSKFDDIADNYITYYEESYTDHLIKNKKFTNYLNPDRMCESGEVYITNAVMALCKDLFSEAKTVELMINVIRLVNKFFQWGDIEAFYIVNNEGLIDNIIRKIIEEEQDSRIIKKDNTRKGSYILKQYKASEDVKELFYNQLLKSIQFWAVCFPKGLKNQEKPSRIQHLFNELRNKLKITIPDDKQLKKLKLNFDENIKKKKVRNISLLKDFEYKDPENLPFIKSIVESSSKGESKIQVTPQGGKDYDLLKKQIIEVKMDLKDLGEDEKQYPHRMKKINKFSQNFEKNLESANLQEYQFDELLNSGVDLIDKIQKVKANCAKYEKKQLSYTEFSKIVGGNKKSYKQINSKEQTPIKKFKEDHQYSDLPSISKHSIKNESPQKLNESSIKKKQVSSSNINQSEREIQQQLKSKTKIEKERLDDQQRLKYEAEQAKILQQSRKRKEKEQKQKQKQIKESQQKQKKQREKQQKQAQSKRKIQLQIEEEKMKKKLLREEEQRAKRLKQKEEESRRDNEQNYIEEDELVIQDEQQVQRSIPKFMHQISGSKFPKLQSRKKQAQEKKQDKSFQKHQINQSPVSKGKSFQEFSPIEKKQASRIHFESQSRNKLMQESLDEGIIEMPDINPLEQSFHQEKSFKEKLKQNKQLSFKKVFESDKYLLSTNKNSKMFKLQQDSFNLIRPNSSTRQQSHKKESRVNIGSVLNERNKKFQQEVKQIQETKERKIKDLEKKIKYLENEGDNMKEKIKYQDEQIKTIKASSQIDKSIVSKNLYMQDQNQVFKSKLASAASKSLYRSSIDKKEPKMIDLLGTLINSKQYKTYFSQFTQEKQKKNLLKNKELLVKNQRIEIGCMTRKVQESLIVTFFITPQLDLQGLTYSIKESQQLSITSEPKNIPMIRSRKQQKIFLTIKVAEFPYILPVISFNYSMQSKLYSNECVIPCSFHKFVQIETLRQQIINKTFGNGKNILRGQESPYSKKLLKSLDSLKDYFPLLKELNDGQCNSLGEISFGGEARFGGKRFMVRISIKPNQFLYVQAEKSEGNFAEFYIALVTHLLMKNVGEALQKSGISSNF